MPIKMIYFDIGGVLVTDGFDRAAPLFSKELGVPAKMLTIAYDQTKNWRYSAGLQTREERWTAFFAKIGKDDADIGHFVKIWQSVFIPMNETIEIAKALQEKYPVGVLSDQPFDILHRLEELGILDLFSIKVISCEVGHSKKEKNNDIYRIALQKAEVAPHEILFIDNSKEYLQHAAATGFQVLLFESPAQLREELEKRDLL
jgi:HAD superfamily hydrolase (TIGR01509 family)